ncbi:unnamed protein product [Phytophthora fragariaefolia]|uniref:Unnamed protein product n=1 Tax=Phytophthora fragariaefolia TaxID=1490495 RepID=A0A9W6YHN2_9STRA|nr:unnamed protein product [Phytophthora fragariaefolia]
MDVLTLCASKRPMWNRRKWSRIDAYLQVDGVFDVADRSYHGTKQDHDSPPLKGLLTIWGLLDPIALARPHTWDQEGLRRHHAETHTYCYKIPGYGEASSRLDRWYVSATTLPWVAAWNTVQIGANQDHHAAKLHLRSRDDPIRVMKPSRIHPVLAFVETAVQTMTAQILQDFYEAIQTTEHTAETSARKWEELKQEIARRTRICIRERRRMLRNTSKQKLARLIRQQQRHQAALAGTPDTVESITDNLDGVHLDDTVEPTRSARLARAIADCKRERALNRLSKLFRDATHWTGKTTKAMFRRVSTKFADNVIHRLDPIPGAPPRSIHEKADILADAWQPIFQQTASDREFVKPVAAWDQQQGKAAGPDRLGNDWYRDYEEWPVTKLLNLWYDAAYFPPSFLEADIFCLKKGGASCNALNFRPLALLNTDEKIYTRILASRVGITLPDTIHPNQNGFVSGRTIHDTLDLYAAAQSMVITDPD